MENSRILKLKSKFFIFRAFSYFSFLLIPVWVTKIADTNVLIQAFMIMLYILFMGSQWFLLGKEVDHRLQIYFRANSSMDRVIYRILLGKLTLLLYFICLTFIPKDILKHFFWGTWIVLGLFYSWPTRGKIIKETMTSNFGEFRFLDSFEKTLVYVSAVLVLISIPQLPEMVNIEALKLTFDPYEKFSPIFWDFMRINYFPFAKYPEIYKLAWCLHFYTVGMVIIILTFYALMRYFVSRRVSILGIFALLSSWSFPKLMQVNFHWPITSSFLIAWIWVTLWATKSQTYRCGLLVGLVNFWGALINPSYAFLMPVQMALLYFFMKDETYWFKAQVLKYMSFGIALTMIIFTSNIQALEFITPLSGKDFIAETINALDRKAFFGLFFFGLLLVFAKMFAATFKKEWSLITNWRIDFLKLREITVSLLMVFVMSLFIDETLLLGFGVLWLLCFLSLIPIEWIFQSLTKLRSRRNIIYGVYILICLLDSHLEGRVKILLKILGSGQNSN